MTTEYAAFIAALLALTGLAAYWFMRFRRQRQQTIRALHELRAVQGLETELQVMRDTVAAMGIRHLPPGRRPDATAGTLQALDNTCNAWSRELKQLHKRLVTNLHALHRAREGQRQLRERIAQLNQMLTETPEYDLRAQFAVISKERDILTQRVHQLSQLLSQGDGDVTARMLALSRQNESLRSELRSARRMIRTLERHIHVLDRQEAGKKGVSMDRLFKYDLPPGAYESLSDTPMEDPVVRLTDSVSSSFN